MLMQRICIVPLVASLLTSCALAAESCQASHANPRRAQDVTFPEPTIGVWMLGDDPCSLPGNYDSDGRIEIKKDVLIGYEQSNQPVQVQLISKAPRTWKIRSTIDIGDGPEPDEDKVFVVSEGMLLIADGDEMRTYTRCKGDRHGSRGTREVARETVATQESLFFSELHGAWDLSDNKCRAIDTHESDSRIEIGSRELHGHEHTESLKSVMKVSDAPSAWRMVSISNIAPPEIQGDAVIYVMGSDDLTISNGESASVYVRCRASRGPPLSR